jgi:hypothetical protein
VTPLFGVKCSASSSSSSGPRRKARKKSFLSAQSAGIEGQIDDSVNILTLDQLQWEEKYLLLKRFQEREGHCNVPQLHTEDGSNLGTWLGYQRQLNRKKKLDPDRQKRIEEIGIAWALPSATWDEMYALLKQFKTREGHCSVPSLHTEDGANLGTWVAYQRQLKKKEKLDPDRETQLLEISFEWGLASATWDEMYALLKQFKKREGDCIVPSLHTEDGSNLGTWVASQRQLKKKEKLNPDRETQLLEIGFEWVVVLPSATWDEMYDLLKQFKTREGHCKVPRSHAEDGANLGTWVNNQRQLKKKEKLDPDREKRLEEIGF